MRAPLFSGLFQLAYVTNDLEASAALLQRDYGAGELLFLRDLPDPYALGFAYSGDTMVELIEPRPGAPALFADWAAGLSGSAIRLHHCGFLIESDEAWTGMRTSLAEGGIDIPMEGSWGDALDYLVADTSVRLGHYLEYIRPQEAGRQFFATIPGSPFRSQA